MNISNGHNGAQGHALPEKHNSGAFAYGLPEQDPVFKLAGVAPDYAACIDLSKTPSPAALHKMKIRHEREKQQKRNRDMESI